MDVIGEMLDSWNDPAARHAMIVHLPVALSVLGVLATLVALSVRTKGHAFRAVAVGVYVLLVGTALLAENSGEAAEGAVNPAISIEGDERLHDHEELASFVWPLAAGTGVLLILTWSPQRVVRHAAGALAVVGALTTAGFVAVVGHYGGTLVYDYGAVRPPAPTDDSSDVDDAMAFDPRVAHFNDRVLPLLESTCWGCHNPNRADDAAELDLTTMAAILRGGKNGRAIIPGDPDASMIVQAIRYDDPFLEMPPDDAGGKLADAEIAAIEQWVRDGAVWPLKTVDRDWPDSPGDPG